MRVIATFFGPCAPDALIAHGSVFSHDFKRLDRLAKLATSSMPLLTKTPTDAVAGAPRHATDPVEEHADRALHVVGIPGSVSPGRQSLARWDGLRFSPPPLRPLTHNEGMFLHLTTTHHTHTYRGSNAVCTQQG